MTVENAKMIRAAILRVVKRKCDYDCVKMDIDGYLTNFEYFFKYYKDQGFLDAYYEKEFKSVKIRFLGSVYRLDFQSQKFEKEGNNEKHNTMATAM